MQKKVVNFQASYPLQLDKVSFEMLRNSVPIWDGTAGQENWEERGREKGWKKRREEFHWQRVQFIFVDHAKRERKRGSFSWLTWVVTHRNEIIEISMSQPCLQESSSKITGIPPINCCWPGMKIGLIGSPRNNPSSSSWKYFSMKFMEWNLWWRKWRIFSSAQSALRIRWEKYADTLRVEAWVTSFGAHT